MASILDGYLQEEETPQTKQERINANIAKNKIAYDKANKSGNTVNYSGDTNVVNKNNSLAAKVAAAVNGESTNNTATPEKDSFSYKVAQLAALNPLKTAGEQAKTSLGDTYKTSKGRLNTVSNLLDKYNTEAIDNLQTVKDTNTQATTRSAFNRERDYANIKAGSQATMMQNLADAGAIDTTPAVDVGSMGIEAQYQGNLDQVEESKLASYKLINDEYVKEKARIENLYVNDKEVMAKELNLLDSEYDDAINLIDNNMATNVSNILSDQATQDKAAQDAKIAAFLKQVEMGSYDALGEEAINQKAKQIGGDQWEAVAFEGRSINDMRNSTIAREGKADEVLNTMMGLGFMVLPEWEKKLKEMAAGAVPISVAQMQNWLFNNKALALKEISPAKVTGTGDKSNQVQVRDFLEDEMGNRTPVIYTYNKNDLVNPVAMLNMSTGELTEYVTGDEEAAPVNDVVAPQELSPEQKAENLRRQQEATAKAIEADRQKKIQEKMNNGGTLTPDELVTLTGKNIPNLNPLDAIGNFGANLYYGD